MILTTIVLSTTTESLNIFHKLLIEITAFKNMKVKFRFYTSFSINVSSFAVNNDIMGIIEQLRYSAFIWYILCQFAGVNGKDIGENAQA